MPIMHQCVQTMCAPMCICISGKRYARKVKRVTHIFFQWYLLWPHMFMWVSGKRYTRKRKVNMSETQFFYWDINYLIILLKCFGGRKGRLVTSRGIVVEIDSKDPKRVRTDTCPGNFHKVLEITRHSTSMISNDTQSQSEHSISQYYWLSLLYCRGGD